MNTLIVQTLHANSRNQDPITCKSGFLAPEFHWMSWALSCLQLKKYYPQVHLFTNAAGKEVLINRLCLPYDTIEVNEIEFHENLWALSKLHTYSCQRHPFLHVDGDVFVWRKFDKSLTNSELVAQNIEANHNFYKNIIDELHALTICLPEEFNPDQPLKSCNAGIIGGTNIDFFKSYAKKAIEFIEDNLDKLLLVKNKDVNMVYEQYFFYMLASANGIPLNCYFKEEISDMNYPGIVNFMDVPFETTYIHMLGSYKINEEACMMLAKRLRIDYPDYYYRIIKEIKKADNLFLSYYNADQVKSDDDDLIWETLYRKDIEQQGLYQVTFSIPGNIKSRHFLINPLIKFITCTDSKSNKPFSILTPVYYKKNYRSVDYDALDYALLEILTLKKSFNEIIQCLLASEDNDLSSEELFDLKELLYLKLKRGCFEGIYLIGKETIDWPLA